MKKKNIIIAGCSRCGKTTLSMKLGKEGFVHYKMDSIKRGIDRNFWDHYQDDWDIVSPYMAHLIATMIKDNQTDIVKGKEYYCIDTCHLYPVDIAQCDLKDVVIVFLWNLNENIDKKIRDIRKYDKNSWSNSFSDEDLKPYVEWGVWYRKKVKEQCEQYHIQFFDTGTNYRKVLKEAYDYIENELKK